MNTWLKERNDLGAIPEKDLVRKMWQGKKSPPGTDSVSIRITGTVITLSCKTPGASIGYKIIEPGKEEPLAWQPYISPFDAGKAHMIKAIAQRIGFEKSVQTSKTFK